MNTKDVDLKVGTLFDDMGRLAVLTKKHKKGDKMKIKQPLHWQESYELTYLNGDICIYGLFTMKKLINNGQLKIVQA